MCTLIARLISLLTTRAPADMGIKIAVRSTQGGLGALAQYDPEFFGEEPEPAVSWVGGRPIDLTRFAPHGLPH